MKRPIAAAILVMATALLPAFAQSRGDWTLGIGAHQVSPASDNGSLAGGSLPLEVGNSVRPSLTLEYFVRDHLGIELLAAWPFEHDVSIQGLGAVATVKQLPPTLSLQYHFNDAGRVSPFLGFGLNYTMFFSEDTRGALAGSNLSLGDSWGLATHAGLDFALGKRGALRIDVRWMDIDSRVRLDGADLGTANIDPWVYGAAYVIRF